MFLFSKFQFGNKAQVCPELALFKHTLIHAIEVLREVYDQISPELTLLSQTV